jgi:hypothetical protein
VELERLLDAMLLVHIFYYANHLTVKNKRPFPFKYIKMFENASLVGFV